jgi:hypothetical protein
MQNCNEKQTHAPTNAASIAIIWTATVTVRPSFRHGHGPLEFLLRERSEFATFLGEIFVNASIGQRRLLLGVLFTPSNLSSIATASQADRRLLLLAHVIHAPGSAHADFGGICRKLIVFRLFGVGRIAMLTSRIFLTSSTRLAAAIARQALGKTSQARMAHSNGAHGRAGRRQHWDRCPEKQHAVVGGDVGHWPGRNDRGDAGRIVVVGGAIHAGFA